MQQHDFSHQNGNFSPHVSHTTSENYSQQSYSDNNGKNSNSRPHISNNKSYNTCQSYSGSVVFQICEKPGTFMQQNVNCVGMQVLYGGSQVQGYSQIPVTREDDNGSETNIANTQNVSQDEYVRTSEEKQEEVVSKEVSKEKVESESETGDEGNQPEKVMEESSDEKDTFPFELCLPDEDSLITVVDYKDMVERNQVKADGVSLSAAVDSSSKPMDTKIGIQDANSSQVYKSEAINDVSDKSSSSSMSNDMYKPHEVNDVRWEAIQAV
ncbi:putative non-specific serine/threonine protein kinase [Rosa chinensis]|uniref:Putative non-specific serine/threonine protein kinase n=1 Tax=Rosa chinensis TaxID=74649 RepID=A0A2P6RLK3_ROSCH|nr:putative non-specific serine/threonine protein kinase [Rosa chinensis]